MRQELQQQLVRRKLGPQQRRQKPQERQRGWQEQILQELQPHTIVPPRSKAPPHKAAPKKRKHEEVASSSSKVAKVAGSKSPAAAEATRPPLQLQATTSKSASSSSTHDVHMYQQPRTPEVEITDDHSRDSDSLPGTPCTDQGAEKEVEEEVEVLGICHPQERYMPRLILAKCDVCQDTDTGPKVCVSAYTQRDCDIAYKDLPKVFCKDCSDAGQSTDHPIVTSGFFDHPIVRRVLPDHRSIMSDYV